MVGARVLKDGSALTTVSTEYRFFAGLRSDPHFKDVHGFRNNFQFTGDDPVARRNVFGVALEVPNEAHQLARGLLPDMLDYRLAEPAGYPNGRRLTDDTADVLLSLLTRGRITSDLVGPHTDLLAEFPFLGLPHPPDEAATHVE